MTLPRYRAICEHWERTPPLGVTAWAIAESLGAKKAGPKRRAEKAGMSKAAEAENWNGLMELFGNPGAGFSAEKPEWATTK